MWSDGNQSVCVHDVRLTYSKGHSTCSPTWRCHHNLYWTWIECERSHARLDRLRPPIQLRSSSLVLFRFCLWVLTSCSVIKMQPTLPSGLFSATVGTEIGYQQQLPVNPEGKNMYIVAFNDECGWRGELAETRWSKGWEENKRIKMYGVELIHDIRTGRTCWPCYSRRTRRAPFI